MDYQFIINSLSDIVLLDLKNKNIVYHLFLGFNFCFVFLNLSVKPYIE
jgi:hypothetical protein